MRGRARWRSFDRFGPRRQRAWDFGQVERSGRSAGAAPAAARHPEWVSLRSDGRHATPSRRDRFGPRPQRAWEVGRAFRPEAGAAPAVRATRVAGVRRSTCRDTRTRTGAARPVGSASVSVTSTCRRPVRRQPQRDTEGVSLRTSEASRSGTCAQPAGVVRLACQTALRARRAVRLRFVQSVHERPSHHRTDGSDRHPQPRHAERTNATRKGNRQRDARHRHLEVARRERARSSRRSSLPILLTLAVIPYGKRRPVGKPLSWGEAMIAVGLRLRRHVPRLRHRAPTSGSTTPTRTSAGARTRSSTAPAASSSRSRPAAGTRSRCSTRRSATSSSCSSTSIFFGLHHLHLALVAEARPGRRRHRDRDQHATVARW